MIELRAYRIMFRFLEDRYSRLPSDVLGTILSDLSLGIWADGAPGDPAVIAEWERAVAAIDEAQDGQDTER